MPQSVQPGDGSFDDPMMSAQAVAISTSGRRARVSLVSYNPINSADDQRLYGFMALCLGRLGATTRSASPPSSGRSVIQ